MRNAVTVTRTRSRLKNKKYSFLVQNWLKKNTIKDVLEKFFEVKITSINTCNLPRKKRRLGKFKGYKTQYKKVIITLDPKDNIQLFSDI